MNAVLVLFDSLNRHYLPPYGGTSVAAPNFSRLSRHGVTFDRSYVCSMPCIPARRDLLTGRPNFLHRSWGPMEPYDFSLPDSLRKKGVSSHLVTDHQHYFEDGGATYHTRFDTFQFLRGQEGDPWMGQVADPAPPPNLNARKGPLARQDWINRQFLQQTGDFPQVKTFDAGLDFLSRNHEADGWLLLIETFDPHEPFHAPPEFRAKFPGADDLPLFDWPGYRAVTETPEEVERCRQNYRALLTLCDAQLGRVLDAFDWHGLWEDTMLIVMTDHGFFLGERGMWAKSWMPLYGEVAHTPFFMWDPRTGRANCRCPSLVQPSIDVPATLLAFFGGERPTEMRGCDLAAAVACDAPVREAAIFGYHGSRVNVTDGRHVYMRASVPGNQPLNEYTLMPTRMRGFFSPELLQAFRGSAPLPFSRGIPVNCYACPPAENQSPEEHLLFNLESDPHQESPLHDRELENRMIALLIRELEANDAPREQFQRLGLA